LLSHYQKLGKFRANHPAVGAGVHKMISDKPYWFSREFQNDKVVIGLELPNGLKTVNVTGIFENGAKLRDAYSGKTVKVQNGAVMFETEFSTVLLEKI